jgi:hypothetical protein
MPTEVLQKQKDAAIRFYLSGSFSPAASGTDWSYGSTPTNVQLTLNNLGSGSGRQSSKADLGSVRAPVYALLGCVDYTGETPTSGSRVDYYWAPSTSGTAANGNVAGNSGVDAAAPGSPVPAGLTLAEFLRMCIYIGSLILSDDGAVQNGFVGILRPPTRWGQLVVVNNGGDVFEQDDVEAHQLLVPMVDELQ